MSADNDCVLNGCSYVRDGSCETRLGSPPNWSALCFNSIQRFELWNLEMFSSFAFNIPKRTFVVFVSLKPCQVFAFSIASQSHFRCLYCSSQLEWGGRDKGRCVPVCFWSVRVKSCFCMCVHVCVGSAPMWCCLCLGAFHYPPMCCLCLWSTGPPHCSSASSSPVEQLPYPPPSIAANQSQGGLLGNCAAQPAQDSDSEDEFGPNSFLVKTGSGNLYAPATATADGELVFKLLLLSGG